MPSHDSKTIYFAPVPTSQDALTRALLYGERSAMQCFRRSPSAWSSTSPLQHNFHSPPIPGGFFYYPFCIVSIQPK
jgi:hypothetical protein